MTSCNSMMPKKPFTIHYSKGEKNYAVNTAKYNINKTELGYELTLEVYTKETKEMSYNPSLELTIVFPREPTLKVGDIWRNQSSQTKDLENLSNFYIWTHENFENYTVEVLEKTHLYIVFRVEGYIELNPSEDGTTKVSITTKFALDKNLSRNVS